MNRPYIFCHMMTSLDGKIMGSYMETSEGAAAGMCFTISLLERTHIISIRDGFPAGLQRMIILPFMRNRT